MAPDGVERRMVVFNNSFPGPLIEANWGDTLVIHVQNNLQSNGYFITFFIFVVTHFVRTSVHWHGILQKQNGANDGVAGVTQCFLPSLQS